MKRDFSIFSNKNNEEYVFYKHYSLFKERKKLQNDIQSLTEEFGYIKEKHRQSCESMDAQKKSNNYFKTSKTSKFMKDIENQLNNLDFLEKSMENTDNFIIEKLVITEKQEEINDKFQNQTDALNKILKENNDDADKTTISVLNEGTTENDISEPETLEQWSDRVSIF